MSDQILTIIVPSYNMEKYLPKCLGSLVVAPELMEKLEVIVVNDGSKDRTSEIAHEFAVKWPQTFRVIDKENGHYGSCVNAALPQVQGLYVRLLDADDYVENEHFAGYLIWLHDLLDKGHAPDLLVADYDRVDSDGAVTEHIHYGFDKNRMFSLRESLSVTHEYIGIHALAQKTELMRKLKYCQLEGLPYTDTQFAFGAIALVKAVAYYPEVVTRYLVGRDGQTMDPEVLVRDIPKQALVAIQNLKDYLQRREHIRDDAADFYREYIETHLKGILDYYIRGFGGRCSPVGGREFDLAIKELYPEFHHALDGLILSRNLRFHYIREWRRTYSNQTLKFHLYRMYNKFAVLVWKMRTSL